LSVHTADVRAETSDRATAAALGTVLAFMTSVIALSYHPIHERSEYCRGTGSGSVTVMIELREA